MDLNKYDTISITNNEAHSLLIWRDNNQEYVRNFKHVLNEGVISVELDNKMSDRFKSYRTMVSLYFNVVNECTVAFKYYAVVFKENNQVITHNQLELIIKFNAQRGYEVVSFDIIDSKFLSLKTKEDKINLLLDIVTLYCSLMAYMTYFEKEFITKDIEIPYSSKRLKRLQREAKYNPFHTIRFNKKVYKINPQTSYKNITKKQYNHHMESWSVSGHWRRHKDTKIWVKPYDKGKGRKTPHSYVISDIEDNKVNTNSC